MHFDNTILVKCIPAIILLILLETFYLVKEHRHNSKQSLISLIAGLVGFPIAVVLQGAMIYIFTVTYQHRLFNLTNTWWALGICFFAEDFSYYWFHRISHQVRFFWASHLVHHSSVNFTLLTAVRVPWTSNITGTFLFWAWVPLIGVEPSMLLFMKSASVIYQFWIHTEVIKKLPVWFEAIFNTPSHHRVHHGSDLEYLDKNHAGILIIWDKIFGTFQAEIHKPHYGLTENVKSSNPIVIELSGWRLLLQDINKSKSIKEKLLLLLMPPGWSADGKSKTTSQLRGARRLTLQGSHI